jgi:phosphatidylserine/phosphatidylglycerophosphate/cardiolipin synthase-like enzyme
MYCYCADFNPLFFELTRLIAAGVVGRFIFDKIMFFSSSCARQAERVHALYMAGITAGQPDILRIYQPPYGGFASMHVKSTLVDGKVLYSGSPNLTHNGLENNKEHYFRMTQESLVRVVMADFDELWEISQPVTKIMVDLMNAKAVEKITQKAEERQQSRNRRSASLNRSLSAEMNRAGG